MRYLESRNGITVAVPTTPTRYPTNIRQNPDILDIAIMKTRRIGYLVENLTNELSSDHNPITP